VLRDVGLENGVDKDGGAEKVGPGGGVEIEGRLGGDGSNDGEAALEAVAAGREKIGSKRGVQIDELAIDGGGDVCRIKHPRTVLVVSPVLEQSHQRVELSPAQQQLARPTALLVGRAATTITPSASK
jgi:hypothetical protein